MCISYGKSEIPEVQLIHFFCWVTFWSFPLNHHLVFIGSPNPQFWLSGRFQHHWGGTWSPGFQSRSKGGPHVNELQDSDPQAIINRLKPAFLGSMGRLHIYLHLPWLVGGWTSTSEKICSSNWVHLPQFFGVKINQYLKPFLYFSTISRMATREQSEQYLKPPPIDQNQTFM